MHQGVFAVPTADVRPVRLWAFNVGFYNLFLACGLIVGVIAWMTGNGIGRALVIYLCLFAFLAGIVLFVSDRLALSRPRGTGVSGALIQGVPPLIALVASQRPDRIDSLQRRSHATSRLALASLSTCRIGIHGAMLR